MPIEPTKRIRDPVHGLIVFKLSDEIDRAAWELLDTPEFQRLRRVKQLGVSEFTFPGATHTRFAHCVGVFHVARRLMKVATSRIPAQDSNPHRIRVSLLAALLHDLGHGPFSHAFEEAEKSRLRNMPGAYKSHEQWTAEIITNPKGQIRKILSKRFGNSMADEVAELLKGEPADLYAAVVSSSFDADRLDYLQRDKMMTGSGAGGIDLDWLIDNLRITSVASEVDEESEEIAPPITTFCFADKAAQAAEAFILARYHLYSQVYFHRTTRGIEQLLTAFLKHLSDLVARGAVGDVCLATDHPLVSFYSSKQPSISGYLALDDTAVWSAVEAATRGKNEELRALAVRLRDRGRLKAIEVATEQPTATDKARREYIEKNLLSNVGRSIFVDRVPLTIYGGLKAGEARSHKRVRILRSGQDVAGDITQVSKAIAALTEKQELLRYYFVDEAVWKQVESIKG
jgi:HD superfamily phosphohydrolase